jgi:hypothetical protein
VILKPPISGRLERDCWRIHEGFYPSCRVTINSENDCAIVHHIQSLCWLGKYLDSLDLVKPKKPSFWRFWNAIFQI